MLESQSRNGGCTATAVLGSPHHTLYYSYAGTPYSAPSLHPTPGRSSLTKSRLISTSTPLHRLKDKFQGVLCACAYHCAHTAFKT